MAYHIGRASHHVSISSDPFLYRLGAFKHLFLPPHMILQTQRQAFELKDDQPCHFFHLKFVTSLEWKK